MITLKTGLEQTAATMRRLYRVGEKAGGMNKWVIALWLTRPLRSRQIM